MSSMNGPGATGCCPGIPIWCGPGWRRWPIRRVRSWLAPGAVRMPRDFHDRSVSLTADLGAAAPHPAGSADAPQLQGPFGASVLSGGRPLGAGHAGYLRLYRCPGRADAAGPAGAAAGPPPFPLHRLPRRTAFGLGAMARRPRMPIARRRGDLWGAKRGEPAHPRRRMAAGLIAGMLAGCRGQPGRSPALLCRAAIYLTAGYGRELVTAKLARLRLIDQVGGRRQAGARLVYLHAETVAGAS